MKQKEILTARETMELLDISRTTFDRYRKVGKLKAYRFPGGRKLYTKLSEVMQLLNNSLLEVA